MKMKNPLNRCPYCGNLEFMVRIKNYSKETVYRSLWQSCRCHEFAEEMEKVRDKYLKEVDNGSKRKTQNR